MLLSEQIEVNGKLYKLQHPGNREWLRLKQSIFNVKENTINLEKLLDYAFEHVVFADGHNFKPTLDDISPEESEAWEVILPNYFRGKVDKKWKPKKENSVS